MCFFSQSHGNSHLLFELYGLGYDELTNPQISEGHVVTLLYVILFLRPKLTAQPLPGIQSIITAGKQFIGLAQE